MQLEARTTFQSNTNQTQNHDSKPREIRRPVIQNQDETEAQDGTFQFRGEYLMVDSEFILVGNDACGCQCQKRKGCPIMTHHRMLIGHSAEQTPIPSGLQCLGGMKSEGNC